MDNIKLFRKRLIPDECIFLKDDTIVFQSDEYIITKWTTLNPKTAFHYGASCYFLKEGFKLSKFYRHDGSLLYWYCDIVEYEWSDDKKKLTSIDLLADVIVHPDGRTQVMDLDELAMAFANGVISQEQLLKSLRQLDKFLNYVYKNKLGHLQTLLNDKGL